MQGIGRLLVISGLALVIVGLVFMFGDRIPYAGKLPGDIFIKRERVSFYFPITACIIVSIIVSILFSIFRK